MSIIISEDYKRLIINDYCSKVQTIKDLCNKYNLSAPTVTKILDEYNVKRYTKQQICSIGLYEDVFKNIDTEEKAYLLGFFLADGCVFYNKCNINAAPRIIFGLQQKDSYIVERFHKLLNTSNSLRIDNRNNQPFISCVVSSFKLVNDLHFYGLDNPKFLRPLPIIRYDLVHHLIRGFFDGDGSFNYRLAHPERKICNSYRGRATFITYEIIKEDILRIFNYIGINNVYIERVNSEVFLEMVNIRRKEDILKLYNFMYQDATIFLTRKKEKFEQYFILNQMI